MGSCGISKDCIRQGLTNSFDRVDFAKEEARVARLLGKEANEILERDEIDVLVREAKQPNGEPVTSPGFVHNRAVSGVLDTLASDKKRGITLQDWIRRVR